MKCLTSVSFHKSFDYWNGTLPLLASDAKDIPLFGREIQTDKKV